MTPEAIDGLPLDGDPSLPPGLVASPSEQSPGLVTSCLDLQLRLSLLLESTHNCLQFLLMILMS